MRNEFKILIAYYFLIDFIISLNLKKIKQTNNFNINSNNNGIDNINENCLRIQNYSLFEFFDLKNEEKDYELITPNGKIYYNFCQNLVKMEVKSTMVLVKNSDIYNMRINNSINFNNNNTNDTIRLSGSYTGEKDNPNKIIVDFHGDDISKGHNTTKVTIKLAEGDECEYDHNKRYRVTFELLCDYNITTIHYDKWDTEKKCEILIQAKTKYACGYLYTYSLAKFLEDNPIVFGIIIMTLGVILCILGYKSLYVTSFLIGMIVIIVVVLLIFVGIIGIKNQVLIYFMTIISVILGIIGGYLLKQYPKVFVLIVGGIMGSFLGSVFYNILAALVNVIYPELVYVIIMLVFISLFAFLGYENKRKVMIFGTSVIGAYCIMRSFALFLKNEIKYISEFEIFTLIKSGNYQVLSELLRGKYFIYPSIFFIAFIISAIIQLKINKKEDEEEDYKELERKLDETTAIEEKVMKLRLK